MVVELATLTAGVQATTELVKQAVGLAGAIRSGFRADNGAAKKALDDKLRELEQSIAHVGDLARMAERYVRSHEDVIELLGATQRAQRLLADATAEFSDSGNARYEANWRVMDTVFSEIDAGRRPVVEATNNRIAWFSERDRNQIEPRLAEFDAALQGTAQSVRYKASSDVRMGIEQMLRPLQTVEGLLRNTLFTEILPALQSLGGRSEAGVDRKG
jgi:hypothetical protein